MTISCSRCDGNHMRSECPALANVVVLPFMSPRPATPAPDARSLVADYLARIHPTRRHGVTDCGEYMDGSGALSDGDHLLMWLGERGYVVVLA